MKIDLLKFENRHNLNKTTLVWKTEQKMRNELKQEIKIKNVK
jgi:hypothetical protein